MYRIADHRTLDTDGWCFLEYLVQIMRKVPCFKECPEQQEKKYAKCTFNVGKNMKKEHQK